MDTWQELTLQGQLTDDRPGKGAEQDAGDSQKEPHDAAQNNARHGTL